MTKMRGPQLSSESTTLKIDFTRLCLSNTSHWKSILLDQISSIPFPLQWLHYFQFLNFYWKISEMKNHWAMILKTEKCNTKKTYSCIENNWVVGALLNLQSSMHKLEFSFALASPDFESSFLWPNSSDQPRFYWCFRLRRLENQDILLLLWTTKDKWVFIWNLPLTNSFKSSVIASPRWFLILWSSQS